MKQPITLFLLAIFIVIQNANAQSIIVQQGTYLLSSGNVTLTANNCGMTGGGNVDLSSSVLNLKGTKNVSIGTTAAFAVKEITINKPSGTALLASNINVKSKVTFINGLLDLNAKNLVLDSIASINGENENTRIIGANGGEVIISLTLNNPQNVNPGNLGATITSSKNLGLTTIKRGHKAQLGSGAFDKSVLRYFYIRPVNNWQLAATLRFNYLDTERNGVDESAANIFVSTNNGLSWTNIGEDVRDINLNYLDKKNLASFAEFTLSNPVNALSSVTENNNLLKTRQEHLELKAWPLPANGPFNLLLNGANKNTEAVIYDNSGRLLQRLTLTPNTPAVISNLAPGIYFIKTADASANSLKIIVQ